MRNVNLLRVQDDGGQVAVTKCPICGGTKFIPAPNNRVSRHGLPPVCAKCKSRERHRVARTLISAMRLREKFKNYRLLLLSNDRIVANGWFKSVETATFDATSSLNDYAAHSYDFIICPHLLQSIADPRKGIQALARILSDEGLLFISYPSPVTREKTVDWGYAKKEQHGHYRTFGRDFESEYAYLVPDFYVVASQGIDPVTNSVDLAYFVTKNPAWVTHIIRTTDARLVS